MKKPKTPAQDMAHQHFQTLCRALWKRHEITKLARFWGTARRKAAEALYYRGPPDVLCWKLLGQVHREKEIVRQEFETQLAKLRAEMEGRLDLIDMSSAALVAILRPRTRELTEIRLGGLPEHMRTMEVARAKLMAQRAADTRSPANHRGVLPGMEDHMDLEIGRLQPTSTLPDEFAISQLEAEGKDDEASQLLQDEMSVYIQSAGEGQGQRDLVKQRFRLQDLRNETRLRDAG